MDKYTPIIQQQEINISKLLDPLEQTKVPSINIYFDIDSLIDTRYTILQRISPTIAKEVIEDKSYYNRLSNAFKEISPITFDFLYRHRTKETLFSTNYVTYLPDMLMEILDTLSKGTEIPTDVKRLHIYVDSSPYMLSKEELEAIEVTLAKAFSYADLTLLSYRNNTSINWIRDNVGFLIIYNYRSWFSKYMANGQLLKEPITETKMLVPMIFETLDKEEVTKERLLEFIKNMASIIEIWPIATKYFCVNTEKK